MKEPKHVFVEANEVMADAYYSESSLTCFRVRLNKDEDVRVVIVAEHPQDILDALDDLRYAVLREWKEHLY